MKCEFCPFDSKPGKFEAKNLKMHVSKKHPSTLLGSGPIEVAPKPAKVETKTTKSVESPSQEVIFYSSKHPFMTVVVKPTEWRLVSGPAGEKFTPVEGLIVEFDNGTYKTSDPVIIAYLEGDLAKAKEYGLVDKNGKPRVYNDTRSPILSDRQLRSLAT